MNKLNNEHVNIISRMDVKNSRMSRNEKYLFIEFALKGEKNAKDLREEDIRDIL